MSAKRANGTTSWSTIQHSAAGDPVARERFVARYEKVVRHYLADRWRNRPLLAELEDAVQDVFVQCFREGGLLERVDPEAGGGFRAFLYGAVRNIARQHEERVLDRRRNRGDSALSLRADVGDDPAQEIDRSWAQAILREAIHRMEEDPDVEVAETERRRELLVLRFDDGLPIRAIAERWGQDVDQLHLEYAKARRAFKRSLKRVLYPDRDVTDDELRTELAALVRALRGD